MATSEVVTPQRRAVSFCVVRVGGKSAGRAMFMEQPAGGAHATAGLDELLAKATRLGDTVTQI